MTNLNASLSALSGKLEFKKSAREINEDDLRRRGFLEPVSQSRKTEFDRINEKQEAGRDKRSPEQKLQSAKDTIAQNDAKSAATGAAGSYICNRTDGRIDHRKTQERREELKQIRAYSSSNTVDWVETRRLIAAKIQSYKD